MREATERLLQALGPTIEAELDRTIAETLQQLESDFRTKMQAAVDDAERQSQQMAEAIEARFRDTWEARLNEARQEATTEAREAARLQLTESFDSQLAETRQQIRSEMQARADEELQSAMSKWSAERLQLQGDVSRWRAFADAQRQLAESTSQTEILHRFIQLSGPFAPSLAVYVAKGDALQLWQSRRGQFPETASEQIRDSETYFKYIVVRDKSVAGICAKLPCDSMALDFLISCLERAIETFAMRMRTAPPRPPVPQPANSSYV